MIIRPLIYLLFFLSTCTSLKDRSLIHAFKFTDKNRQELKRVLGQYQEDSPKFAASHFIIRNMLGKQSVDTNSIKASQPYFDAWAAYFEKYGRYKNGAHYVICDSINRLHPNKRVHTRYIPDLQHISADFLIRHIDYCFHIWQQYPWCKDIDFDTFCKYILPYTTSNCYWEYASDFFLKNMQNCETLFNKNHTKKSELSCRKMLTGPLLKIGCFLLENIRDCYPPPLKTLQKHRSGPAWKQISIK